MDEQVFQQYLAQLVERMKRGERSAFDAFTRVLQIVGGFVRAHENERPEWDDVLRRWAVSTAVIAARPEFQPPPDLLGWVSTQLERAVADLLDVEDLQKRITRAIAPPGCGMQIGCARRAKAWLSRDFVDVVSSDGWTWIILGDARGHGPAAAFYGNTVFPTIRPYLAYDRPVVESLRRANELLHRHRPGGEYAVAQIAGWNPVSRNLDLANAGLTVNPIIITGGVAKVIELASTPLGMFPNPEFGAYTHAPSCGDLLILASDGIIDQRDRMDEEYGHERLVEFILGHPSLGPDELAAAILEDVNRFGDGNPDDDQTVVVVQF